MQKLSCLSASVKRFRPGISRKVALVGAASACAFSAWQIAAVSLPYSLATALGIGLVGVLSVVSAVAPHAEDPKARREYEESIDRVKKGVDRLRKISLYDPATALLQRWYFELRLEEEVQRSRRFGQPVSVIVVKVQAVAPTEEGSTSEDAYPLVAHVASASLRGIDIVTGLDAQSYAFCLPNTDRAGARIVGRRLREVFASRVATYGLASFTAGESGKSLLEAAWTQAQEALVDPFALEDAEQAVVFEAVPPPVHLRRVPQLRVASLTARQGELITIEARVAPFELCSVSYITPGGREPRITVLQPKRADEYGAISWSWRIGRSTIPGQGSISVSGANGSATASILIQKAGKSRAGRPELMRLAS